jgi:membrane protein YdbS with pleckstrin-like domain
MSLVPVGTAPASVYRYLLPHEAQVLTVRFHPAILIGPVFLALAGFAAALGVSSMARPSGDALLITWLLWAMLLLYALGKIAGWSVNYFVVTSERLIVITGILARDVAMLPLSRAHGLRLRRTTFGRLLGYGQFIFEPVGQDPALRSVNFLPYAEQLYLEVNALLFPNPEEPEEPEEPEDPEPDD